MFFDFEPLITLILAFYLAAGLSLLVLTSFAVFGLVRALRRMPARRTIRLFRVPPSFRHRKAV